MQHTDYDNFGGVKIPRDVGSESQGSPNVHVKILRQNANACLQLPTSLKMPSDQRDQSTMAVFAPPQVAWGLPYATKDVAEIVEGPIPDEGHGVRQQPREDADHVRHH